MEYLTHQLLSSRQVQQLKKELLGNQVDWRDGKESAGDQAAKVKNNLQLARESSLAIKKSDEITSLLQKTPLIKSFTLPKYIHGLIFSLSKVGEGYGTHIDNAYMSTGRSDLSFTLFISDSTEYSGGELIIQSIQGRKKIKLNAGEIIIYPSNSLHSVAKVSSGERLVCVGWIHSYVKSNEDRISLFGLEAGAKGLLARVGQNEELDLIFQSYSNFLRRLGE